VVPIGHERGTPYLPTHPDAEDGDRLVAYEAYQRSRSDRPKESHGLRVQESLYGLVSGHHRAEKDDQHDEYPGQILHPAVTEREAPAGAEARQREGDPKRHGSRRVSEVVDGVRQEGDAAGEQHDA